MYRNVVLSQRRACAMSGMVCNTISALRCSAKQSCWKETWALKNKWVRYVHQNPVPNAHFGSCISSTFTCWLTSSLQQPTHTNTAEISLNYRKLGSQTSCLIFNHKSWRSVWIRIVTNSYWACIASYILGSLRKFQNTAPSGRPVHAMSLYNLLWLFINCKPLHSHLSYLLFLKALKLSPECGINSFLVFTLRLLSTSSAPFTRFWYLSAIWKQAWEVWEVGNRP